MGRVLAVDIGASSYRVMEGTFLDGRISMKELARFSHAPVWEQGHYYWDVDRMKENLIGVIQETARAGEEISSIGFDTFGTDFGLIDHKGCLLSKPLAYRDSISDGMYQKYFQNEERLYQRIGGTYANTSTAHLLMGMKEQGFESLKKAGRLLFLPDLLAWMFTGTFVNEYTIATSSRLLDVKRRQWDWELINDLGLPGEIFHPLSDAGTVAGRLKQEISAGISNLSHTVVTAVACHDTASAVVTVPKQPGSSFISSGSWSVKGVVSSVPYTSMEACRYQMSNEGQPKGQYRLIRNIAGLWILEECMRSYREKGHSIGITELVQQAEKAEEFPSMIYTDAGDFAKPGHMPEKIQSYCKRTGQKMPETPVEIMQTVIGGLACEYRLHNEELCQVTGQQISRLYIVGGGSRNGYLNQCAANITGCTVSCGHPEATALGNLLMQMKTQGQINSIEEFLGEQAFSDRQYEPENSREWEDKYGRYLKIRKEENETDYKRS